MADLVPVVNRVVDRDPVLIHCVYELVELRRDLGFAVVPINGGFSLGQTDVDPLYGPSVEFLRGAGHAREIAPAEVVALPQPDIGGKLARGLGRRYGHLPEVAFLEAEESAAALGGPRELGCGPIGIRGVHSQARTGEGRAFAQGEEPSAIGDHPSLVHGPLVVAVGEDLHDGTRLGPSCDAPGLQVEVEDVENE